MNPKALHKISYGLYIVTSKKGDQINGQVANTVFQISNDPTTVAVSINKQNLTSEFIRDSKVFGVSVLAQEAPLSLIGRFGFKSGRQVDKFAGINYKPGITGVPCLTDHVLACMEAEVIQEVDAGTHHIFIGKVTGAEVLKEGIAMTYAYYHQIKKGTVPQTAPTYTPQKAERMEKMDKYVCNLCGYVYDPATGDPENGIAPDTPFEKLPEDWVCPVCGAGKDEFSKEE
ncbi:rubredoxin [Desulfoscipio geothermicus]|uniref:NADH-FMN oxidoreductase RutF, flavin reductase (DIM6/NTAB) family n=1 Tax=Desulfoscipio geothermicus DSM 3669 TaxID=1121426 RepID=A0A1I6DZC8_9FIRM|nr:flavin reductase [Desulfoscipio geothermicus]SFR10890.1 NADH-FMN oxidoreductase RutF, flavin reductase (DIM6/NTAB) family [Desulfoscipio geothermicus DSM 3669]